MRCRTGRIAANLQPVMNIDGDRSLRRSLTVCWCPGARAVSISQWFYVVTASTDSTVGVRPLALAARASAEISRDSARISSGTKFRCSTKLDPVAVTGIAMRAVALASMSGLLSRKGSKIALVASHNKRGRPVAVALGDVDSVGAG
jgi:hypothetical protein